jgi:predicted ATPase
VGRGAPRAGYIVAIEQPELHLHPAMQARLADLFVNTVAIARKRGIPIRFIIETHSQSIVNRLGHLVEGKRVDSGDVQIILFERGVADADPLVSTLRRSRFDDEGVLTNWPFGFFLPEIDDSDVAGTDSLSEEQSPSK